MKLRIVDLRSQFDLFVLSESSQVLDQARELSESGYHLELSSLDNEGLEKIRQIPPHVVFIDFPEIKGDPALYADQILRMSPESLIIAMVDQIEDALPLKGKIHDFILKPFLHGEALVLLADNACDKIFQQYQIEQLQDKLKEIHSSGRNRTVDNSKTSEEESEWVVNTGDSQGAANKSGSGGPSVKSVPVDESLVSGHIMEFLKLQKKAKDSKGSIKSLLDYYHDSLEKKPILFFQYLPVNNSLAVSQSMGLPSEKVRGIGLSLSVESDKIDETLENAGTLSELKDFIKRAFKEDMYSVFPFFEEGGSKGLFVKLGAFSQNSFGPLLSSLVQLTEITCEKLRLKFKLHGLQNYTSTTELFNRTHFQKCLKEEISRSRRTKLPVSFVMLCIDDFDEYKKAAGPNSGVKLQQAMADILKKTSRLTDVIGDFENGEFVVLLPHTDQKGAAIKAEKIRRIVEKSQFPKTDLLKNKRITLSVGVSEYPSVSSDSDSLIKTADDALFHIKTTGGNKVCMASAADGFLPDFQI